MECLLEKYRKLAELNSLIIKPEKVNGKLVYNKHFNDKEVKISLNATVWKITDWRKYKKYISVISIPIKEFKNYDAEKIKNELLTLLYKEVMEKNNIML